jgi:hypothetical protein
VSNNVGIDFTELGPPYGPSQGQPPKKNRVSQIRKKISDHNRLFGVKLKEKAIIDDNVNRMYNQFVIDPNTKEQKNVGLSLQQTCDQTCN